MLTHAGLMGTFNQGILQAHTGVMGTNNMWLIVLNFESVITVCPWLPMVTPVCPWLPLVAPSNHSFSV